MYWPRSAVYSFRAWAKLVQGRLLKALRMFVLAGVLWIFWMGWIIHIWSIIDAALFKAKS